METERQNSALESDETSRETGNDPGENGKCRRKKQGANPDYMKLDDMKKMTDEELVAFVDRAKGHTGSDFQEHMQANFSYSSVSAELTKRGFIANVWVKKDIADNQFTIMDETDQLRKENAELKKKAENTVTVPAGNDGIEPDVLMIQQEKGPFSAEIRGKVDPDVAEQWKEFNCNFRNHSIFLNVALRRFLEDIRSGRLVCRA